MKKIILILLSVVSVTWAQSEFTLNNMDHIFQSTQVNPAAVPDHKFSLGLPLSSIYFGSANTGFAPKDVITTSPSGEKMWNFNALRTKISEKSNFMYGGANFDLFHLRFKIRRTFVSFNVRSINNVYFNYPDGIGKLATFKDPVTNNGTDVDLSTLAMNLNNYMEYAVGLSTIQNKFVLGARFKLLQGLNNITVNTQDLKLGFGQELYDISVKGSGSVQTSIPTNAADLLNFKNLGFAGDFGFTYLFRKNLHFGVAVNNIGFITWKTNARNSEFSANSANFSGVDALGSLLTGGSLTGFNIDSITKGSSGQSSDIGSYTNWLIPNTYLTAKYYVTARFSLSAALMLEYYKTVRPAVSIGAQYKLGRLFSLTGTANYQYTAINVGAGIVFKPGPFQLYILTDNILFVEGAIRTAVSFADGSQNIYAPSNGRSANIRFGMNIVLGREHLNQQQSFDKKY